MKFESWTYPIVVPHALYDVLYLFPFEMCFELLDAPGLLEFGGIDVWYMAVSSRPPACSILDRLLIEPCVRVGPYYIRMGRSFIEFHSRPAVTATHPSVACLSDVSELPERHVRGEGRLTNRVSQTTV